MVPHPPPGGLPPPDGPPTGRERRRTPVVLVVDTGVDDALALAVATRDPRLRLVAAVAACGNVSLGRALSNTRHVLDRLQATAPVVAGAAHRLDGRAVPPRPGHGHDGLAGLAPTAGVAGGSVPTGTGTASANADAVARLLAGSPTATVVCCAPLTTLALVLARDPGVLTGRPVVATAALPGEPNERMDPAAAAAVRARVAVTDVGYDRFAETAPAPTELSAVAPDDPASGLVRALLDAQRRRGAGLGDATAVLDLAEGPAGGLSR